MGWIAGLSEQDFSAHSKGNDQVNMPEELFLIEKLATIQNYPTHFKVLANKPILRLC